MNHRRSNLTPPLAGTDPALPQTRRAGGARRNLTERVHLFRAGQSDALEGWALNVSRGGIRLIVEEKVELGEVMSVVIGEQAPRESRIVWIQEEPDGSIVGLSFLDAPEGAMPPRQGSMPEIDLGEGPPPSGSPDQEK